MNSFSSTKSLIPQFAKSYGFDVKILEGRLQKEWSQIVGISLASHTRPDSIKFRQLILVAENSVWLQQLVFLKPMILEKLNAFAQETPITDIILRIGEIRTTLLTSVQSSPSKNYSVNPSATALELASDWTKAIKDPGLRSTLHRVIAKDLSLNHQLFKPHPSSQS